MAWRIVKQPNGLLARFSDIVDNFTDMNMNEEEALEVCREYCGIEEAQRKVLAGKEDWKIWTNGVQGNGLERWMDSLERIVHQHGKLEMQKVILIGINIADDGEKGEQMNFELQTVGWLETILVKLFGRRVYYKDEDGEVWGAWFRGKLYLLKTIPVIR